MCGRLADYLASGGADDSRALEPWRFALERLRLSGSTQTLGYPLTGCGERRASMARRMTILDPFVLPADVIIAPVAPELRDRIGNQASDCAVTRPHLRTPSSVVDARTAALLQSFRSPTTIVDAVIAFGAIEASILASCSTTRFPSWEASSTTVCSFLLTPTLHKRSPARLSWGKRSAGSR